MSSFFGRIALRWCKTTVPWRDGRAVEGAALELLFRGDSNEGSNPSLSVVLSMTMARWPFLSFFVLPNVLFHVTTAYAILRHNGVELGKRDFLGQP